MLDLDQQLRKYGSYLDGLDPEPVVSIAAIESRRRPRRWIAVAAVVTILVGTGVAIAARRGSNGHVTIQGGGSDPVTTQSHAEAAMASAHPTFAQQIARLEGWAETAAAEAPGGRPILISEFEVCDYRSAPSLGSGVQTGFASYFLLAQPLTDGRLVDGCLHRDDIPPGTVPPVHELCSAIRRGPVYDMTAVTFPLTRKPVVIFGATDCHAAGFDEFPRGLFDQLNARRHTEIEILAVPRSCPSVDEATAWVEKVTDQRLGSGWTIVAPPRAGNSTPPTVAPTPPVSGYCVRPYRVDWDLHRVLLERFR
jgi:hypothetical protein